MLPGYLNAAANARPSSIRNKSSSWTPVLSSPFFLFCDSIVCLGEIDGTTRLFQFVVTPCAFSEDGDPLEVLAATVDFEYFQGWLVEGLDYGDDSKGGRPPFDPVSMFKILILQAQHNLGDARMEFMIRDRLSWMRFLDFDLGGPTPDENIIRLFHNKLMETGTLKRVMKAFDWQLHKKGYIPMSGQIVDASLVLAPKQRNTDPEKGAVKAGKSAQEIWPDEPSKAAQKDVDALWTLKIGGKVRYRPDGTSLPMIALPVIGYKSHISIDRRFGFIRG